MRSVENSGSKASISSSLDVAGVGELSVASAIAARTTQGVSTRFADAIYDMVRT